MRSLWPFRRRPEPPGTPLEAWRRLLETYKGSPLGDIEAAVAWARDHEMPFLQANAKHFRDPVSSDPEDLAITHEFMRRYGAYLRDKGAWNNMRGMLSGQGNGARLTIEEIGAGIAEGCAANFQAGQS
jgi:hypothetical protein